MRKIIAAIILLALCQAASAQTSPGLSYGQVLTAGQWNALFAGKQDNLGFTPLNVAGGTMAGRLVTATPGSATAGFGLTCGTAPGSPVNGDVWCTSSGVFVQVNGSTVGPLGSSTGTMGSVNITNGTGLTESGTCNSTSAISCTLAIDKATSANYFAGTANKVLTADNVYQGLVTVAYNASQVVDFSTGNNFQITMTGNITSLTINNIKAGQAGSIQFVQDGTGSRTLPATLNANMKFAGGVQPVASTGANQADIVFFTCYLTNYCPSSFSKNFQ